MKRIFNTNNGKFYALIVCLTFFYALVFIYSEFHDSPIGSFKDFIIMALQWGVISFATFGLLYFLAINKYIFSIFFPIITTICGVLTYFRYTANISLTPMIIDITFVNDVRTCLSIFSIQLVLVIILSLLFSIFCVYYRWKYIKVDHWYIHLALSLIIILLTNSWVPGLARPISERMPYSIYYSMERYIEERKIISGERILFEGNATSDADSLVVVFVLGESLRYDHLQLNGYERNTTPYLSSDSNVVSYPNIYTVPIYTHTSVPNILTRADSIDSDRAYTEQSFITLFKQAGFHTSWLANQESVSTYVYFMNECDTLAYVNGGKSLYIFDKWLDIDLVPYLESELERPDKNKFILMHTIGSHWWYNSHFEDSFAEFQPIIKSRVISSNTREEMINSYDNTILYTDYVMKEIINRLRNKKAILLYLSDHGESLGEDGFYTHGADRPILHRPACFMWYSPLYESAYPDKIKALKNNRLNNYYTDFFFHSILDAANIESEYKIEEYSIFK